MTIFPLIGIGFVVVVLGLTVAVAVTSRKKPDVNKVPVDYTPVNELPETHPDWTDDNIRAFADTVPYIRFAAIGEAIADMAATYGPLEVQKPEGDPEQ